MQFSKEINLQTVSEANSSQHWSVKYFRHRDQKKAIQWLFLVEKPVITLPCKVILTRIASRFLDSDNLQSAFKYIRDQIAEQIILDKRPNDNDPRINWIYKQEKVKRGVYRIRIEII